MWKRRKSLDVARVFERPEGRAWKD